MILSPSIFVTLPKLSLSEALTTLPTSIGSLVNPALTLTTMPAARPLLLTNGLSITLGGKKSISLIRTFSIIASVS